MDVKDNTQTSLPKPIKTFFFLEFGNMKILCGKRVKSRRKCPHHSAAGKGSDTIDALDSVLEQKLPGGQKMFDIPREENYSSQ